MHAFIIAITLHNFPEGMAVGVGFAGSDLEKAMPLTLGFAAGAMLFIISDEIIPETHRAATRISRRFVAGRLRRHDVS